MIIEILKFVGSLLGFTAVAYGIGAICNVWDEYKSNFPWWDIKD